MLPFLQKFFHSPTHHHHNATSAPATTTTASHTDGIYKWLHGGILYHGVGQRYWIDRFKVQKFKKNSDRHTTGILSMLTVTFSFSFPYIQCPLQGLNSVIAHVRTGKFPYREKAPLGLSTLCPYSLRGSITSWSPTLPHHSHASLLSDPSPWYSP